MNRADVSDELLEDVKNELGVTWKDEATDNLYRGFIARATTYLNGKGGTEFDYEFDGDARALMIEYVRYARDAALDVFENNYLSMILSLQNRREVDAYLAKTKQAEQ